MKFSPLFLLLACLFNIGLISAKKKGKNKADSNCRECGQSFGESMKTLIVNGKKVDPPNKYPWVVGLMTLPKRRIFCAGSIINRHYILTAAHCVAQFAEMAKAMKKMTLPTEDKELLPSFLSFNELQVGFVTDTYHISEGVEIENIICYPGYKRSVYYIDDIALLKLKKPIKYNDFARPVCLPGKNIHTKKKDMFVVAGWGFTTGKRKGSTETLNEARIVFKSEDKCDDLRDSGKNSSKFFCLEGYNGGNPCFGDSGGSMFKQYKGRYYAIGVASSSFSPKGKYCDSKDSYLVYTTVQAYMPWIQNITGMTRKKHKPRKKVVKKRKGSRNLS